MFAKGVTLHAYKQYRLSYILYDQDSYNFKIIVSHFIQKIALFFFASLWSCENYVHLAGSYLRGKFWNCCSNIFILLLAIRKEHTYFGTRQRVGE